MLISAVACDEQDEQIVSFPTGFIPVEYCLCTARSPMYEQPLTEPPLSQWPELLTAPVGIDKKNSPGTLRDSARRRLIEAAEQFVLRLHQVARSAGLPDSRQPLLTGDPMHQAIVMAGHQPVIFHSGLTFKYETTERFAADQNAIAVAVVIDSDDGDAGGFRLPQQDSSRSDMLRPGSRLETVAQSRGMMAHAKLKPAADLNAIAERAAAALREAHEPAAAERSSLVLRQYAQLSDAGASVMEANLILRWLHGIGGRMLELPLSAIAAFPEALSLTAGIVQRAREFAVAYNSELGRFREQHQIRNSANPFPDLYIDDESCELPFWVVDHNRQTRHALHVATVAAGTRLLANGDLIETVTGAVAAESFDSLLVRNQQIVPRGALITGFLRLLFADLFVHGTGGGHYDPFTGRLTRMWWNVEAAPFAVASASRYLFAHQRAELTRLDVLAADLRDLQHNPQRHFGDDTFPEDVKTRLAELQQRKLSAVDRMKTMQAHGESAKEIGREIQDLSNRIKTEVTAAFAPRLAVLQAISQEHRNTVDDRTYPWFFFGNASE